MATSNDCRKPFSGYRFGSGSGFTHVEFAKLLSSNGASRRPSMPRMTGFLCLAIATLVLFPVPAQASDNYPSRPIRLIVGVAVAPLPNILVVNPKLGVNDVKGLIAMAKANPGELLYGASGVGSGPHLTTELFAQMAGIKKTSVRYPGSAQTVTDLIAGRVQIMFAPASTVLGLMRQGTVKALATTGHQRASIAPDLPTISEDAIPDFDTGLWFGILAPTGTPAPIIEKLSKATNDALKDPQVLNQLDAEGLDALGGSPDDFGQFIKSETERWARVIHTLDIPINN